MSDTASELPPLPDKAAFAEHINDPFSLQAGQDITVELVLDQVDSHAAPDNYESFSIVFSGPADPPLDQGTYPLTHARLGRFFLFLVPISGNQQQRRYEAVFNLKINEPS